MSRVATAAAALSVALTACGARSPGTVAASVTTVFVTVTAPASAAATPAQPNDPASLAAPSPKSPPPTQPAATASFGAAPAAPPSASTDFSASVVWPDGRPAANATIDLFPEGLPDSYSIDGGSSLVAHTDRNGVFHTAACPCPILDAYYYFKDPALTTDSTAEFPAKTGDCALILHLLGTNNWDPVDAEPGRSAAYQITAMECNGFTRPENTQGEIDKPSGTGSPWQLAEALNAASQ